MTKQQQTDYQTTIKIRPATLAKYHIAGQLIQPGDTKPLTRPEIFDLVINYFLEQKNLTGISADDKCFKK